MTLPSNLNDALVLLGQLVQDPLLILGLQTLALILIGSGAITWVLLAKVVRR